MSDIKIEDFMVTAQGLEAVRKSQEKNLENAFLAFVFH